MANGKPGRPKATSDEERKALTSHMKANQKRKLVEVGNRLVRRAEQYNVKYPTMLVEHCSKPTYTEVLNKVTGKMDKIAADFPSIQSFRLKHKIPTSTRYDWLKSYPELAQANEIIKDAQANFLIQNGLNGTYNPTIVKFVGANELGMADKKEVTHTNTAINDNQKRKIIEEYMQSLPDGGKVEILDIKEE